MFHATGNEAILGLISTGAQAMSQYELFVAFEPLVTKAAAQLAAEKLLRAIRSEEEDLFILNPQVF